MLSQLMNVFQYEESKLTWSLYSVLSQTLCRWLLSVKKNYRPNIYHNWRHAFNVAQSMFTMITVSW